MPIRPPAILGIPTRLPDGWGSTGTGAELLMATNGINSTSVTWVSPTSSPRGGAYASVTRTDDYTVTSTTFIDLDATNLKHTINVGLRKRVLVLANCSHNMMATNQFGYLDLDIDGVRQGTSTGLAWRGPEVGSGQGVITFAYLTAPMSGTHTFKLQARVDAGTGRFGLMFWGTGNVTFKVMERG